MSPVGLYIHVPFCFSKCPYCDFYSLPMQENAERVEAYTAQVCSSLRQWGERLNRQADTLYFGGGTPSLLGGRNLAMILETAAKYFGLNGAEITMEANPADELYPVLRDFSGAGGNRLSMGMQSADERELRFLGRRHSPEQLEKAVEAAQKAGITNFSLDMMLGLAGQTAESVARSAETCRRLGAKHVSAYLLKVEEGTPFFLRGEGLGLPGEEETVALYLAACEELEKRGYPQYEISNFACPGFESRHNLKYWNAEDYLGIGPAAHSFLEGCRFGYSRDLSAFLRGDCPLPEDEEKEKIEDGSPQEYAMLRLRLTKGLTRTGYRARFGEPIPALWEKRAAALPETLLVCDETGIHLTREGFLVSNAIIRKLLL